MPYNIKLSEKCKNLAGEDDYEEFRDHGAPNTEVEDEMLRAFLAGARKEGMVESFSEKVMMTMEA